MTDFSLYQSPFSWRYGSPEMRLVWSEENKRRLWRRIWVALAKVESSFGLVGAEQVRDLEEHAEEIDLVRSMQVEAQIHHDLMAEVKVFAAQCPKGGGIIHLGATSMDIKDNAEVLQMRRSMDLLLDKLKGLLLRFAEQIETYADMPCMAFTHLQPAEPTTLGYRFASYAQDLLNDWEELSLRRVSLRGKGFKGAVGTAASYAELVGVNNLEKFERGLSEALELEFFPISTQTYTRKQDYQILSALAGMGITLYKFAVDLRLLQSPPVGEWAEPFAEQQVGSSAMPFKRNPIKAEEINSLSRLLAHTPLTAWHNAASSFLERTLDDSANRRVLLPESFLICDEILEVAKRILDGLTLNVPAIRRNVATYAPFANTERLLMLLVKAGADRQVMHARLRQHALAVWQALQEGQAQDLSERLARDEELVKFVPAEKIRLTMQSEGYTGFAAQRARWMAEYIRLNVSDTDKMLK